MKRIIILIISLLLGVSGAGGADAMKVQAAKAENTAGKEYTPYELCCMAQYYYKRTSEDGFYPPEAECEEQEDGTYLISLREKVIEDSSEFHYETYAEYNVDMYAKGTDTLSGKAIDLTLYSTVYTPEELCRLAQDYFFRANDFYPPNTQYTLNKDETYTICLFEMIDDAGGTAHKATCGWYTVNVCGVGTDDLTMQEIDINP